MTFRKAAVVITPALFLEQRKTKTKTKTKNPFNPFNPMLKIKNNRRHKRTQKSLSMFFVKICVFCCSSPTRQHEPTATATEEFTT